MNLRHEFRNGELLKLLFYSPRAPSMQVFVKCAAACPFRAATGRERYHDRSDAPSRSRLP